MGKSKKRTRKKCTGISSVHLCFEHKALCKGVSFMDKDVTTSRVPDGDMASMNARGRRPYCRRRMLRRAVVIGLERVASRL
jgi:hypothetical protein